MTRSRAHDCGKQGRRPSGGRDARLSRLHAPPAGKVLMTANGWLQILLYCACVLLVAKPLGIYLVKVYDGSLTWLGPVERLVYRLCRVDAEEDQHWTRYAGALLLFSLATMLLTYAVLRLQHALPLNPQG